MNRIEGAERNLCECQPLKYDKKSMCMKKE